MPTVLLVENDGAGRDALARRLEGRNYHVLLAADGRQAVSIARTVKPDLILMDLGLPEVDGWKATAQLKDDRETQHIPIIVLTALTMPNDLHKALAARSDDFDTKPVEFSRLIGKMEVLLMKAP